MHAVSLEFKKNTGHEIELVWMEKNELKKKLEASFGLNKKIPDLAYIDPSFRHPRIGNALLPLTDLEFGGNKVPYWKLGNAGGGTDNYLPFEGQGTAIYYNKHVFEKAGIRLPENRLLTSVEFLEIIKSLRSQGITPIAEGAADRAWKAPIPIVNTMIRFAGHEKIQRLISQEIDFSDQDIVRSLNYWKQVIDAGGYDCPRALNLTLSEGIFEMTDGRAAISFCGTWIYSKYANTPRDQNQVGVMDWFNVPGGKGNNSFGYVFGAGYGINRNSQKVEIAKKFLHFLMTAEAARLWYIYVQSPYPIIIGESQSTPSLYGQLASRRLDQNQFEGFAYLFYRKPSQNNMWASVVKEFICGQRTVAEFVDRMNSRF